MVKQGEYLKWVVNIEYMDYYINIKYCKFIAIVKSNHKWQDVYLNNKLLNGVLVSLQNPQFN